MNHHHDNHGCPQCRSQVQARRSRLARRAMPLLAAGVVGAVLPLMGHADAGAFQVASAPKKPAFSGYSTNGQAMPMKIEVFEPTIPIPANPQAEIDVSYTTTEADSSSSHGRASYVWPGDAVGEGFKTIAEALGLPLPAATYENGYPVQVNALYPAGPDSEVSEPTPGQVMRASATKVDTSAESAFSSDCSTSTDDPADGGDAGGGGGLPGLPGLPLPGLPGLPALPGLAGLSLSAKAGAAAADEPTCPTPTQLDALISTGNGQAVTKTHAVTGKQVFTQARAAASDIKLAGGLVTISGVSATGKSFSDGKKPDPSGKAHYGTLKVAGQPFTIGSDGIESPAGGSPIPGLPDAPAAALKELGISFAIPKPEYHKKKLKDGSTEVSTHVEGLVVTIDAAKLRNRLNAIPFDDITGMIPDQAGDLKSALQAATHLASKFVIHLAVTDTQAKTVPPLAPFPTPTTPTESPTESTSPSESPSSSPTTSTAVDPGPGTNNGGGGGDTGTGDLGGGDLGGDVPSDTGVGDLPPTGPSPQTEATGPVGFDTSLPPLFSIPGLLLYGGLAGGALAGAYVRRLGIAALGGTSACPHGLDSGLPDLRKA